MPVKITSGTGPDSTVIYLAEPVPNHTNVHYMAIAMPDHLIMIVIRKKAAAIYVSEKALNKEFFEEMKQAKVFHSVEKVIEEIVNNSLVEVKFRSTRMATEYLKFKLPESVMESVAEFLPQIEEEE